MGMISMQTPHKVETARLFLREFTLDDAPFFLALVNDADWLRFIGDRNVHTLGEARAYLTKHYIARYEQDGFGIYLAAIKESGEPIGMCGLIKREGLADIDIGFAFMPAYRGQGYAYEAAAATMIYARETLKLARIVAITVSYNAPSIALLEKIGLKFERDVRLPNDPEPLRLYALTL